MTNALLAIRRWIGLLRASQGRAVALFVDDPLKVHHEIRFLLLRLTVFVGIAAVLIGAGSWQTQRMIHAIEEKRGLVQDLYKRFDSVSRLSHDVVEGRAALVTVRKLVLNEEVIARFIETLDAFATTTGASAELHLEQGVPVASPAIPSFRYISYTMSVQGTMRTLLRYLDGFYTIPYLLTIDAVQLQGESGLDSGQTTMQISGRVYIQ